MILSIVFITGLAMYNDDRHITKADGIKQICNLRVLRYNYTLFVDDDDDDATQ